MAEPTAPISVWIPGLNCHAWFHPREVMRRNRPVRAAYRLPEGMPSIVEPIDWSKGGAVSYPMDGNDTFGDCMYAAACHMDNTWTACNGQESTFDESALVQSYRRLSGGDNGLDEQQITSEWENNGLAGDAQARILGSLDIDPTDAELVKSAMFLFGGVFFMLSVPNQWINNSSTGAVWDGPARPNPMNGHGVCWVGTDAQGRYRLVTWGTFVWITPQGVADCDPSAFVCFSNRWFDPRTGLAPNGLDYDQLAELWARAGGKQLPPSPFPSPLPAP